MHPVRDLSLVLSEYAQLMSTAPTADEVLEQFGRYCADLLPIDGVGILLRDESDSLVVATADSELGRLVEELETALHEGPCTDALRTGTLQAVPDLAAAQERYPRFAPLALAAGVRSVHGLPITARSETIGAGDLIASEVLALSAEDLAVAQLLCDVTSAYLVNAQMLSASTKLTEQLQRALDSRVAVEQAKGVLSERHKIGISAAFERLRGHARSSRMPIRAVAQSVIAGDLDL